MTFLQGNLKDVTIAEVLQGSSYTTLQGDSSSDNDEDNSSINLGCILQEANNRHSIKRYDYCQVLRDLKDNNNISILKESLIEEINYINDGENSNDQVAKRYKYCREVIRPYLKKYPSDCPDQEEKLIKDVLDPDHEDFPDYQSDYENYENGKSLYLRDDQTNKQDSSSQTDLEDLIMSSLADKDRNISDTNNVTVRFRDGDKVIEMVCKNEEKDGKIILKCKRVVPIYTDSDSKSPKSRINLSPSQSDSTKSKNPTKPKPDIISIDKTPKTNFTKEEFCPYEAPSCESPCQLLADAIDKGAKVKINLNGDSQSKLATEKPIAIKSEKTMSEKLDDGIEKQKQDEQSTKEVKQKTDPKCRSKSLITGKLDYETPKIPQKSKTTKEHKKEECLEGHASDSVKQKPKKESEVCIQKPRKDSEVCTKQKYKKESDRDSAKPEKESQAGHTPKPVEYQHTLNPFKFLTNGLNRLKAIRPDQSNSYVTESLKKELAQDNPDKTNIEVHEEDSSTSTGSKKDGCCILMAASPPGCVSNDPPLTKPCSSPATDPSSPVKTCPQPPIIATEKKPPCQPPPNQPPPCKATPSQPSEKKPCLNKAPPPCHPASKPPDKKPCLDKAQPPCPPPPLPLCTPNPPNEAKPPCVPCPCPKSPDSASLSSSAPYCPGITKTETLSKIKAYIPKGLLSDQQAESHAIVIDTLKAATKEMVVGLYNKCFPAAEAKKEKGPKPKDISCDAETLHSQNTTAEKTDAYNFFYRYLENTQSVHIHPTTEFISASDRSDSMPEMCDSEPKNAKSMLSSMKERFVRLFGEFEDSKQYEESSFTSLRSNEILSEELTKVKSDAGKN